MEETRISRMYLNLVTKGLGRGVAAVVRGAWLRSPVTWIVVAVLGLVGVGVAVHEKGRGDLTRLKAQVGAAPPVAEVEAVEPGGQAPIVLSRDQHPGSIAPEFLSATLLPGRGMNVLQITAFVPGKGIVSLMASPSLEEAAKAMSGGGEDAGGQASLTNGAAFEVPWAGRMLGTLAPGGLSVLTNWSGHALTLPVNWTEGAAQAVGGLLLRRGAGSADPSVMPDGGVAEASFDATDFDGHWPSKSEVKTTVVLSARTVDLTVVARNAGTTPEPMGIGWRPRFTLSNRSGVRLHLPSAARAEEKNGLPTGILVPASDFTGTDGAGLGSTSLDALYTRLKGGALSEGPEVEVQDSGAGYTLRMTLLSSSIKALRVNAPARAAYLMLDPQTNLDDPLGREWKEESSGFVVLQPGESLQWKVRLELLPLAGAVRGRNQPRGSLREVVAVPSPARRGAVVSGRVEMLVPFRATYRLTDMQDLSAPGGRLRFRRQSVRCRPGEGQRLQGWR